MVSNHSKACKPATAIITAHSAEGYRIFLLTSCPFVLHFISFCRTGVYFLPVWRPLPEPNRDVKGQWMPAKCPMVLTIAGGEDGERQSTYAAGIQSCLCRSHYHQGNG